MVRGCKDFCDPDFSTNANSKSKFDFDQILADQHSHQPQLHYNLSMLTC